MTGAVSRRLRRAALKAELSLAGVICALVGVTFLTIAAWLALAAALSSPAAALILGMAYLGLGLVFLALAGNPPRRSRHAQATPQAETAVEAFLMGLSAGLGAGRREQTPPET